MQDSEVSRRRHLDPVRPAFPPWFPRHPGAYATGPGAMARMHGFTWRAGHGFITVDNPDGEGTTTVNGVNDAGDLVGFYTDAKGNVDGMLALPRH